MQRGLGTVRQRWARVGVAMLVGAALLGDGLAQASSPEHTPLLTFIANSRTLHPSVEIAGVDGSRPRRLGAGMTALVSPSGSSVAVVASVGPQSNSSSQLLLYSQHAGPARKLLREHGYLELIGWSRDSKLVLAFASGGDETGPLMIVNVANGRSTVLARGLVEGASFAPHDSYDVVYGLAKSLRVGSQVNLFVKLASGGPSVQITHDGASSDPIWGPRSIVFVRARSRGSQEAPINQLWSISPNGSGARQLTHMSVGPLVEGLVPTAISADGRHLLADFEGTDTSAAWTVDLSQPSVSPRPLNGIRDGNIADAISRDGTAVLLTNGFEGNATSVEAVPWGGGRPTVLAGHGADASWNR